MISVNAVKMLHIEISTMCNARCPQCPRNFNGWNEPIKLDEKNINIDILRNISKQFPNRTAVFCGNHGDPMMHKDVVECARLFKNVSIDTNGSIGRLESYRELAKLGVHISFNIDGLEDTNHIYRQDTIWENIMDRAKAFIEAGGNAQWRFIVFRHNKHQIEEAKKLSKAMGFKDFVLSLQGRDYGPIMDDEGKIINWLLPHDRDLEPYEYEYDIEFELGLLKKPLDLPYRKKSEQKIDCELKRQGNIYFNVDGEMLPCCYHGVKQHIHPEGDTYQEQLDSFKFLEQGWGTDQCNETCYNACGIHHKIDR